MSRICMSFDEGSRTLSFFKQRYDLDKDKMSEPQMSRREYLDFVWWLKCNVSEADFPVDMRTGRTMFNRYTYDCNAKPRCFINTILTEDNEYLYKGLSLLMMRYHGYCVVSKRDRDNLFEIPVYYEEDLYNVIKLHGVRADKAKEFTAMSVRGMYKTYCRGHNEKDTLLAISPELHKFCKEVCGLPSRLDLVKIFQKQFEEFVGKKYGSEQGRGQDNV